ncbi:MAG: nucleotidyltransferase domain-containing protein [Actinomycetota bacterium]|nr:nucleotidyltransferase domain-containing protein [Actinomycetota bacterium]
MSGVQREVDRLETMGLVTSAVDEGGRRQLRLVAEHPFADALAGLVAAEARVAYAPAGSRDSADLPTVIAASLLNPRVRGLASAIVEASREFGVTRLALFGSATENDPAVVPRDLDVSVRFDPHDSRSRADLYFGFRAALERAAGLSVDVLEIDSVDNPYLLRELAASEVVLYEAT